MPWAVDGNRCGCLVGGAGSYALLGMAGTWSIATWIAYYLDRFMIDSDRKWLILPGSTIFVLVICGSGLLPASDVVKNGLLLCTAAIGVLAMGVLSIALFLADNALHSESSF